MSKLLASFFTGLIVLTLVGCGAVNSPSPTPSAPTDTPPTPALRLPNEPVGFSRVKTEFGQPLSSGISLPDMVENALLSVVEIRTATGGGTGFIVNGDGLVVTNKHVVQGARSVILRLASGNSFRASVVGEHDTLDLAYVQPDSSSTFTPIAIGDSDDVRVGESVIVIGFPIADRLGAEPTVSQGIVSAKRSELIQTDAPVNPGNSGGPMLDQFGNVIGVIVSRVEESGGRDISGIGFAIPINEVRADLGAEVSPGQALPTPTPTPRPTIAPTFDLDATKTAIDAEEAFLRTKEATEYQIEQERQEAERYAASLEATRIANRPTPTPEPTPTPPPPTPTPTPHPATFCQEWEAMVLEWIKQGNYFWGGQWWERGMRSTHDVPDHPQLSAVIALDHCAIDFPTGILSKGSGAVVGDGENQLMPGTYEYRHQGYEDDNRVKGHNCLLRLNRGEDNEQSVEMPYGVPFTFQFLTYHGRVYYGGTYYLTDCGGSDNDSALYRIGD